MKSNVMVLLFGESLNYKSDLGLFVTGSAIFWPLNMATFAKTARVGTSKKARSVPVQKFPDHF